ncbi:MAG TPA: rhodanese-like domain-containing protein [Candidatus Acidoferrales bacterium]|nr:rhodanese-like domain-containing protein [Candidatus Acidoferrales bacterium]
MKKISAGAAALILCLWISQGFSQQQRRYPVDPETRWAVGAKQKPAEELKGQLGAGADVMIIDVRSPASFQRETIPGAINIPFAQLGEELKKLPKGKMLVFT